MYPFYALPIYQSFCKTFCLVLLLVSFSFAGQSQNCPLSTPVSINSNPNTYYPGIDATVAAGALSITLGASGSGTVPIATGDLLLLIQMQGAQINSANTNSYGDGLNGGFANGYLSNGALAAGNMEYIVSSTTVPLTGGVLTLQQPTVKSYKNAAFSTDGQYRYQVIRVGLYYNLTLSGNITAALWNGTTGGVLVINVSNSLNFNGKKLSAAAAGFRGGGARELNGGSGGVSTDLVTSSTKNYNASKGEGLAGTPRFVNNNGTLLDNGAANEGYANGSSAMGAPGNAGGGGTDGNPSANDQNSGGGGGANGGAGGKGGNSWSSNLPSGGEPGALFQQNSPARLVMGGGGGAGTTNNGTGFSISGFSSSGASGGGIVLLTANIIKGTGTIDVSGDNGNLTVLNDGSGGAGAGGSVLLYVGSGLSGITVTANGGLGGTNTGNGSPHGPGGGGGGGVIYSNIAVNAASSAAGGAAGNTAGSSHYGAASGNTGIFIQNITKNQTPPQFLNCSLLPVRFVSLTAALQQQNAVINWQVSYESDVNHYSIERSTDGINFTEAGVKAYNNIITTVNQYSFTDTKANNINGTIYYRIKELSDDGNAVYSNIISIKNQQTNTEVFSVNPNPVVNGLANIKIVNTQVNSTISLRLVALSGNTVWQKQFKASAGVNNIPVDLQFIRSGSYFLQYNNGAETITTKIIVAR